MRVLITGVSGFVGSRLAPYLTGRGDQVSGTYISEAPELDEVRLFEADNLDQQALRRVLEASDPEVVIHLAGLSHVGDSWNALPDYFQVNVVGTENLLAAAEGRRVVLASSAEVYGEVPEEDQPLSEERPVAPPSPYSLTKAAAERLALSQGVVVARCFNIVGGGQSPKFALPAFASQLAAIRSGHQAPVLQVGNLSARRDFVHVADAVEGYRILATSGEPGTIYNLGSGQACSIQEALDRLIRISGVQAKVEVDPERIRPVDVPLLQADIGKLERLGWSPTRSLDDALEDLWSTTLRQARSR